ncbi:MAG: hypothetical protein J2P37_24620 [Ktedonobacteraceae bacterium]|nr:hypothetical protein [Ktedonobacteraceae bacterium]
MSHEDTTTRRVLAGLGQQSAPPSLYGHGRRVLYRCPTCQYPWFMDGPQTWLRPTSDELTSLAQELGADLSQLPRATCRLCALAAERGILEIDEYGEGKGGYGWNWLRHDVVGMAVEAA